MKIEILGPGCAKCDALATSVQTAVERTGVDAEVIKISKIAEMAKRGILSTPALVIDGEVKAVGKVLTVEDLVAILA